MLTWKRVSLPRHQICSRQNEKRKRRQAGETGGLVSLQLNEKERRLAETNLVFLDDAVLVVWRRRVPGDADGSAVLVPHRQDSDLLRGSAGSWKRRHQISRSPIIYSEE